MIPAALLLVYTFLKVKELTIKSDKRMIRQRKKMGWACGINRKLNVAKHPATVMGIPVKYPLFSEILNLAKRKAPQLM